MTDYDKVYMINGKKMTEEEYKKEMEGMSEANKKSGISLEKYKKVMKEYETSHRKSIKEKVGWKEKEDERKKKILRDRIQRLQDKENKPITKPKPTKEELEEEAKMEIMDIYTDKLFKTGKLLKKINEDASMKEFESEKEAREKIIEMYENKREEARKLLKKIQEDADIKKLEELESEKEAEREVIKIWEKKNGKMC